MFKSLFEALEVTDDNQFTFDELVPKVHMLVRCNFDQGTKGMELLLTLLETSVGPKLSIKLISEALQKLDEPISQVPSSSHLNVSENSYKSGEKIVPIRSNILGVLWSKKRSFICPSCFNCFKTEPELQAHIQEIHGNSDYIRNQCPKCNKCFSGFYSLKMHLLTHDEILDWKCEWCYKSFTKKYMLNEHHDKAHLALLGEKKFQCMKCHSRFESQTLLKAHMMLLHNVLDPKASTTMEEFLRANPGLKKISQSSTSRAPVEIRWPSNIPALKMIGIGENVRESVVDNKTVKVSQPTIPMEVDSQEDLEPTTSSSNVKVKSPPLARLSYENRIRALNQNSQMIKKNSVKEKINRTEHMHTPQVHKCLACNATFRNQRAIHFHYDKVHPHLLKPESYQTLQPPKQKQKVTAAHLKSCLESIVPVKSNMIKNKKIPASKSNQTVASDWFKTAKKRKETVKMATPPVGSITTQPNYKIINESNFKIKIIRLDTMEPLDSYVYKSPRTSPPKPKITLKQATNKYASTPRSKTIKRFETELASLVIDSNKMQPIMDVKTKPTEASMVSSANFWNQRSQTSISEMMETFVTATPPPPVDSEASETMMGPNTMTAATSEMSPNSFWDENSQSSETNPIDTFEMELAQLVADAHKMQPTVKAKTMPVTSQSYSLDQSARNSRQESVIKTAPPSVDSISTQVTAEAKTMPAESPILSQTSNSNMNEIVRMTCNEYVGPPVDSNATEPTFEADPMDSPNLWDEYVQTFQSKRVESSGISPRSSNAEIESMISKPIFGFQTNEHSRWDQFGPQDYPIDLRVNRATMETKPLPETASMETPSCSLAKVLEAPQVQKKKTVTVSPTQFTPDQVDLIVDVPIEPKPMPEKIFMLPPLATPKKFAKSVQIKKQKIDKKATLDSIFDEMFEENTEKKKTRAWAPICPWLKDKEKQTYSLKKKRSKKTANKSTKRVVDLIAHQPSIKGQKMPSNEPKIVEVPSLPVPPEHHNRVALALQAGEKYIDHVKCYICKANFYVMAIFKDHILAHNRSIKTECDFCCIKINSLFVLVKHATDCQKIEPYNCIYCYFNVKVKSEMLSHLLEEHPNKPLQACYRELSRIKPVDPRTIQSCTLVEWSKIVHPQIIEE